MHFMSASGISRYYKHVQGFARLTLWRLQDRLVRVFCNVKNDYYVVPEIKASEIVWGHGASKWAAPVAPSHCREATFLLSQTMWSPRAQHFPAQHISMGSFAPLVFHVNARTVRVATVDSLYTAGATCGTSQVVQRVALQERALGFC